MAAESHSIRVPISTLFRDPRLRAAFERAERDLGSPGLLVPVDPPKPVLSSGAAAKREVEHV